MFELVRRGKSFSGYERHCCFLNTGQNRFANVSSASGFDYPDDGRSVLLVDWDLDGDLDVWLVNRTGPQARFLRNEVSNGHHFLALRLQGTRCNRDAIGARVELTLENPARGAGVEQNTNSSPPAGTATLAADKDKLIKTLRAGDGFMAQSSKWVHFGLGKSTRVAQLVVRWPGGQAEEFTKGVQADGRYLLVQGTADAQPWEAPARTVDLRPSDVTPAADPGATRTLLIHRAPLPPLEYRTSAGETRRLPHELPRPLLLNLWASWCRPCLGELQEFASRREDFKAAGLDVLALAVDGLGEDQTDPQAACELMARMKFPYAYGLASELLVDRLQMVHDLLFDHHGGLPVPTSILIDRQGRMVAIYKGPVSTDQVMADRQRIGFAGEQLHRASLSFDGQWLGRRVANRFLKVAMNLNRTGYAEEAAAYLLRNHDQFIDRAKYNNMLLEVGVTLARQGQHQQALPLFRQVQNHQPESASIHFYLGQSLEGTGKAKEALAEYRQTVKLDSKSVLGNFHIGLLMAKHGKLELALKQFRKTVQLQPDWAVARFKLVMVLQLVDQPAEALTELKETIRLGPQDFTTQMQLAWMLATHSDSRFRDAGQAVQWGQTVCQATDYKSFPALDVLGAAYAEAGQFDEAIATTEKAIQIAKTENQHQLAAQYERRLQLYQEGQPFRAGGE